MRLNRVMVDKKYKIQGLDSVDFLEKLEGLKKSCRFLIDAMECSILVYYYTSILVY